MSSNLMSPGSCFNPFFRAQRWVVILVLGLVGSWSSGSLGGEGGGHTNGGGNLQFGSERVGPGKDDPNVVGLFNMLLGSNSDPDQIFNEMRALNRVHPEIPLRACKVNGNTDAKSVFPLSTSLEGIAEFYFSMGFFENFKTQHHLYQYLCDHRKLLDGYREAYALYVYVSEHDEIGSYIAKAIHKIDPSPLQIVIEEEGKSIDGTTDYSWYDPADGAIHWSVSTGRNGILGRGVVSVFKHELMHALTHRALKNRYPLVKVSHDPLHPAEDPECAFCDTWISNYTSVDSAYIEGLANSIERKGDNYSEHPYMKQLGFSYFHLFSSSQNLDRACFSFSKNYWYAQNRGFVSGIFNSVQAPTSNEVYVSSSIQELFHTWIMRSDVSDGTLIDAVDYSRMKTMIDAVVHFHPANVAELARALDSETHSDLGTRWYLEYYFVNLRTGKSLFDMTTHETKYNYDQPSLEYCLRDPRDINQFFKPLLLDAEKKAKVELDVFLAQKKRKK